jgi:hypothetical protein
MQFVGWISAAHPPELIEKTGWMRVAYPPYDLSRRIPNEMPRNFKETYPAIVVGGIDTGKSGLG